MKTSLQSYIENKILGSSEREMGSANVPKGVVNRTIQGLEDVSQLQNTIHDMQALTIYLMPCAFTCLL